MISLRDASTRDLHLRISDAGSDAYRFELREGIDEAPSRFGTVAFTYPPPALVAGLRAMDDYVGQPISRDALIRFGRELARLLPETVHERLLSVMRDRNGNALRLWLEVHANQLDQVPWEFLYLLDGNGEPEAADNAGFIGLDPQIHILRRPAAEVVPFPPTTLPLRILVATADPQSPNHPALSYLTEELSLIKACLRFLSEDHVEFTVLEQATPGSLERKMREFRPHILHFIGHGERRSSGHRLV